MQSSMPRDDRSRVRVGQRASGWEQRECGVGEGARRHGGLGRRGR
jgi:hypothetical protein